MYRKTFVLLVAAIVPLVLPLSATTINKSYTFSTNDIEIDTVEVDGVDYHTVYLKDCHNWADDLGNPSLPVEDVHFIIPHDEEVDSVTASSLDSSTILNNAHPLPQQYPTQDTFNPFIPPSYAYYVYPSPGRAADVENHGVSAEAHLVKIRLYPVQFDPENDRLKLYTSFTITLHLSQTSSQTMVVYRDSVTKVHKEEFWKSMVENPSSVHEYLDETWSKYRVVSDPSSEKMAIITNSEMVPAFQRLAEWKTQRGCSTGVYLIEEIGTWPAPVLGFIREKVDAGCLHILLGGGYGIIPIMDKCSGVSMVGSYFTDLYYADCGTEDASGNIYEAWDENGNGRYGEPIQTCINVRDVSFVSSNNGFIVGTGVSNYCSLVVQTTDGGQSWSQCCFLGLRDPRTVHAIDGEELFVGGDFGICRVTKSGSAWDWEMVHGGENSGIAIYDIYFVDDDNGWAVGYDNRYWNLAPLILKTTNGGLDWAKVTLPFNPPYTGTILHGVDVVGDTLWAVGENTILRLRISTGAVTEEWRGNYEEVEFTSCAFGDQNQGCAYSWPQQVLYRRYYDDTEEEWLWEEVETPDLFSVAGDHGLFATHDPDHPGRMFAIGNISHLSDDYGDTWTRLYFPYGPQSPVGTFLESNPAFIWIAGKWGTTRNRVLVTDDGTKDILSSDDWEGFVFEIESGDEGVREWDPDVEVGRLPVHNLGEAEILVDKIITYEKNPPEQDYPARALFLAASDGYVNHMSGIADAWDAFRQNTEDSYELYIRDDKESYDPGNAELKKTTTINALKSGYNFVFHHDHGTCKHLGTGYYLHYWPEEEGENKIISDLDIVPLDYGSNWQKQHILLTGACNTAYYLAHGYGGNVAIEFLRNPRAGCVAYIGSVLEASGGNAKSMITHFAELAFDSEGYPLGETYNAGIENVTQGGAYNFHLLGDPSLQMWNGELDHFADAVGWEENGNEVNVTVYNDEQPPGTEDNATVCLYMKTSLSGNGYYEVQPTVNGVATFNPAPPDGAILITVTKQNFIPHQEWRLKGNVSDTPIVVHYSHPTEHPNTRNIAIDINGNLHLVYTDKEDGKKIAKYAFSVDTAKTWVIKEIDPNEEQETHSPALALRNGITPYVAYLVRTDYCKVANLAKNVRIHLDEGFGMGLIGGPGFVINNPNEAYVAMRSKSRLYYRRIDLDKLDQGRSDAVTDRMEKYFSLDKMQDPQMYFGGSGSAIGVVSNENLLLGNKTAKPIIVADRREESGSIKLYYWFPEEEPDGHDPEEFCEGWQPSISTDGAYVAVAYSRALKPRVRRANFYGPLEGSIPEEETPPQAEGSSPQTFHPDALVWPYGKIYLSVYDSVAEEWTIPCGFGSSISYYPSADVNIPLDLGACAWSSKDENDDYWLHVYVNGLDDFPNEGGGRKFPKLIVTSPEAGDIWRFGVPEFIQWWQSKDSDGWTIDITWNADPSWHLIDDGTGHRYAGPNSYLWEVGKLKYGRMPVGYQIDEDNYMLGFDSCYIKVTCENMTGISKRFCITPLWVVWPPKEIPTGPLIVGTPQQTEWGFVSAYSCSQMNLLISTNNGLTFDSLYYGSTPTDSSVYDTVIFGPNNDTLVRMLYTGTIDWEVPNTHCSYNAGCLKLVAEDTTGDTASCVFGQFTIPLPGCHVNSTAKNQRIIAEGITSGSVGIAYTTKASDTSSSIIRYTETSDGLSLSEPDSVGIGILPAHSCANVVWLSANQDSVFYSYWDPFSQTFPSGYLMGCAAQGPGGGSVKFAPAGVASEGDTVYTAVLRRKHVLRYGEPYTEYLVELRSFLKDNPQSFEADTIPVLPRPGWDTTKLSALSLEVLNGERHLAFAYKDTCLYFTDGGSVIALSQVIAEGLLPTVAVYEGNVAYSYLSSDSTRLIRLWRYRDDIDITWVSADTLILTDTVECLTAASGLLYGAQLRDSAKAQVCLYGPLSEAFYLQEELDGYYLHARHIPGDAEQWYLGFTQVDNSNYFLSTRVEDIRTLYPALYLRSALGRSPYTSYRDTCILIDDIYVDYGQDSLVYEFDRLSPATSYSVLLEFLCDADTTSAVAIEVNGQLDTLLLPAEGTMWYETDLSGTSELEVYLHRLGTEPITLRRLVVRHSDPKGYAMGGPQGGPIPTEIPFCLYQPLPNPFGDAAMIRYSLPYATHVSLKVYDITGRLVTKLVDGEVEPGVHTLRWDAKDDSNRKCASGVYFVRFATKEYQASKKMVLIK